MPIEFMCSLSLQNGVERLLRPLYTDSYSIYSSVLGDEGLQVSVSEVVRGVSTESVFSNTNKWQGIVGLGNKVTESARAHSYFLN